jgi:serine/threonine protein kinase
MIYIIDFGLAKKYQLNGSHIAYKDNKNLTGTARYASINTHLGIEQGRRDDLEGMLYMLIYFFLGQLPWQNMDAKDKKEKYEKILEKKLLTTPDTLCHDLPPEFITLLKYVRSLQFDSKPDYDFFRKQFEDILANNNLTDDKIFCWNTI